MRASIHHVDKNSVSTNSLKTSWNFQAMTNHSIITSFNMRGFITTNVQDMEFYYNKNVCKVNLLLIFST